MTAEDLQNIVTQQAEIIKSQTKEINDKNAEIEKMRHVDIGKSKDLELARADNAGYKQRIKELEDLERIRVGKEDFLKASELPQQQQPQPQEQNVSTRIWTPVSNCVDLLKGLRPGIDAYNRWKHTNEIIVFETQADDKTKIVSAHLTRATTTNKENAR
jgi:hypothetical protein